MHNRRMSGRTRREPGGIASLGCANPRSMLGLKERDLRAKTEGTKVCFCEPRKGPERREQCGASPLKGNKKKSERGSEADELKKELGLHGGGGFKAKNVGERRRSGK